MMYSNNRVGGGGGSSAATIPVKYRLAPNISISLIFHSLTHSLTKSYEVTVQIWSTKAGLVNKLG
jgi:hypothetical protein